MMQLSLYLNDLARQLFQINEPNHHNTVLMIDFALVHDLLCIPRLRMQKDLSNPTTFPDLSFSKRKLTRIYQ